MLQCEFEPTEPCQRRGRGSGGEQEFGVPDEEGLDRAVPERLDVGSHAADRVGAPLGVGEVGGERLDLRHAVALDLAGGPLPEEGRDADLVDENLARAARQGVA